MNTKLTLVLIAIVLVLGVLLPFGKESKTVIERVQESGKVGGLNSPDLFIGNARLSSGHVDSLYQATTSILCSLNSPSSTSTLISADIQLTTSTGTVQSLMLARGSAQYVASTFLSSTSVTANTVKTLEAVGTTTVGGLQFSPNTYLIGMIGGGMGLTTHSGSCNAVWMVD